MAYNEELATRLRKALAHLTKVEEKKMFRGITFMVNDKMCISVSSDRIMCRIDPAIHDEVIKKEGCQTVVMGGRQCKGYVYINENFITSKKDFDYWVSLALDFNKIAKSSKKVKK